MCYFLANQECLLCFVFLKKMPLLWKKIFKVIFFFFQGFTELLPIDLIKIFDENELEVCIVNILCKVDFLRFSLLPK